MAGASVLFNFSAKSGMRSHGGTVRAEPNRQAASGTVLVVRLPVHAKVRMIGLEVPPAGEPPSFVVRRASR